LSQSEVDPDFGCVAAGVQRAQNIDEVAAIMQKRDKSVAQLEYEADGMADEVTATPQEVRPHLVALFVGPFAFDWIVERMACQKKLELELEYHIRIDMKIATPPFHTDDLEAKGWWLKPDGHTEEKRAVKLKSQVTGGLVVFLTEIEKYRPRLVIGVGQGGVVVAMSSFPVMSERACRDRAVTQHQMETFRQAWAGVTSLLVVDLTILPTSNNLKSLPFDLLRTACPMMTWAQPRTNRRAIMITKGYLTPLFAERLSEYMGCPVDEREKYPEGFLDEAKRPPPIYFETQDTSAKGVCCVCLKKGVLGRCPNPECGLLMHLTCVPSTAPGKAKSALFVRLRKRQRRSKTTRRSLSGMKRK